MPADSIARYISSENIHAVIDQAVLECPELVVRLEPLKCMDGVEF